MINKVDGEDQSEWRCPHCGLAGGWRTVQAHCHEEHNGIFVAVRIERRKTLEDRRKEDIRKGVTGRVPAERPSDRRINHEFAWKCRLIENALRKAGDKHVFMQSNPSSNSAVILIGGPSNTDEFVPTHRHAEGGEYEFITVLSLKPMPGAKFLRGVLYRSADGTLYVREEMDFLNRFEDIK